MNKHKPRWLLYVEKYELFKNKKELVVYQSYYDDVYHTIGEMYSRTLEAIYRIDFVEWNEERKEYWNSKGVKPITWINIHTFKN